MKKVTFLILSCLVLIASGAAFAGGNFGTKLNDVWSFENNANGTWEVVDFNRTDVDGPGGTPGPAIPLVTSKATPDTEEKVTDHKTIKKVKAKTKTKTKE